jgi:hypothetical protein
VQLLSQWADIECELWHVHALHAARLFDEQPLPDHLVETDKDDATQHPIDFVLRITLFAISRRWTVAS